MTRPPSLRRSWLFVPGADEAALGTARASGADVLIQDLEDFTAPAERPRARGMSPSTIEHWRASGCVAGVRINALDGDGRVDLAAVMPGRPDLIALPKVDGPDQVRELDRAIGRLETDLGLVVGSTEILPNIELALGLVRTVAIAGASDRVKACLLASEDLAADLGAERGPDGIELAYCRQRFLVECVAGGVVAVDCPYTWRDAAGVDADTRWSRRLGYPAKSCVVAAHAPVINRILTPSVDEIARAARIVAAFDRARLRGEGRIEVDGSLVEVPIYLTARRLLDRARDLGALE
jgi:citrate lyase subunit beta/citryl-CoA lyase